jgi:hypothetical protein
VKVCQRHCKNCFSSFFWVEAGATLYGDISFFTIKRSAMKKLLFIFLLPMVIPAFAQKWAKDFDFVDNPSNGLSLVKKDGKYGFVDLNGKIVVPIEFQEAVAYSEGFAPVRKGSLWGFYDSTGKVLVQPVYLDALCFHEGMAAVATNEGWGFINVKNDFSIKPQYEAAKGFHEGLAAVQNKKGLWGYIDKDAKQVIAFQYSYAENFENGEARVMKGDKVMNIGKDNVAKN